MVLHRYRLLCGSGREGDTFSRGGTVSVEGHSPALGLRSVGSRMDKPQCSRPARRVERSSWNHFLHISQDTRSATTT